MLRRNEWMKRSQKILNLIWKGCGDMSIENLKRILPPPVKPCGTGSHPGWDELEAGGLLPWGFTDNGDELYWLTQEDSSSWTIVVYESCSSDYHEYPMSMVDFLYEIVSGNMVCGAFPEDFPGDL